MKRCLFTIVLVCCALTAQTQTVNTFYVSPSGSDANPGTAALPWATFQNAVDNANPGDVIKVLPGTYRPVVSRNYGVKISRSGTSAAPITIQGEGGRPVLDCSGLVLVGSGEVYCVDLRASWWIVKGMDVTGAKQNTADSLGIGVQLNNASNNVLNNVRSHGNQGPGFLIGNGIGSNNNLLLNCDAYDNYDPLTGSPVGSQAGNNADGFAGRDGGNVVDGGRSWHNSDDGFDVWSAESPWVIRNSWAWANGYGVKGNGVGFKMGRNDSGPRHKVCNNLAFNNKENGFDTNGASGTVEFLNNTAYNNGSMGFALTASWHSVAVSHYLRNNLSIGSPGFASSGGDQAFNSWNLSVTGSTADFLSVDANLALAQRNANGSLPTNNLFRLAPTSDLIDKGVNVGTPYSGGAPDLGAYEFGGTSAGCNRLGHPAAPTGLRLLQQ